MLLWALDFDTRSITQLAPDSAAATQHFRWFDLTPAEFDTWVQVASSVDLPERLGTHVLEELEFSDAWFAFGLAEPRLDRDRTDPAGLNLLFAQGLLITVDFGACESLRKMRQTWREDFSRHAQSPGFFLFEVADHYVTVAQHLVHALESSAAALHKHLFESADDSVFGEAATMMQRQLEFRQYMMSAHEVFDELATRNSAYVPASTQPYIARNADRIERVGVELLQQRDGLMSALNLYIGMTGHRTGQLLKRLTAFSIIFLPLSFLAGVFGMNFEHMPGIDWHYGYVSFWVACLCITSALLWLARRGRWF